MIIPSSDLSPKEHYHMLASTVIPRPIAWISTKGGDGSCNLAPFSFFNAVTSDPPMVSFSAGPKRDGGDKDTIRNLKESKECVIHIIDESLADAMTLSAHPFAYGECEIEKAGLETQKAKMVDIDIIKGAKIAYECKLDRIVEVGNKPMSVAFAEILCYHILDGEQDQNGVKESSIKALGRLGGKNYIRFDEGNIFQSQVDQKH